MTDARLDVSTLEEPDLVALAALKLMVEVEVEPASAFEAAEAASRAWRVDYLSSGPGAVGADPIDAPLLGRARAWQVEVGRLRAMAARHAARARGPQQEAAVETFAAVAALEQEAPQWVEVSDFGVDASALAALDAWGPESAATKLGLPPGVKGGRAAAPEPSVSAAPPASARDVYARAVGAGTAWDRRAGPRPAAGGATGRSLADDLDLAPALGGEPSLAAVPVSMADVVAVRSERPAGAERRSDEAAKPALSARSAVLDHRGAGPIPLAAHQKIHALPPAKARPSRSDSVVVRPVPGVPGFVTRSDRFSGRIGNTATQLPSADELMLEITKTMMLPS